MGLRHVRFTVRRLMLVVAVVALILGVETARRRWYYLREAAGLTRQAGKFRRYAREFGDRCQREMALIHESEANRMDQVSREYRRAADHPWGSPPENELLPD
jgi:hypothetical protein